MFRISSLFSRSKPKPLPVESRSNVTWSGTVAKGNWEKLLEIMGFKSKSGMVVNSQTVMGIAAAYCAIRILSETIASLPFHVYERKSDGSFELATAHPVDRLISSYPSDLYTSFVFRETLMAHLCTSGNAYVRIFRNNAARPVELRIIDPKEIEPILDVEDNLKYYLTRNGKVVDMLDIIHIPALGFNGLKGLSPIAAHAENLGMTLAATRYGSSFYGNNAHVAGYLSHSGNLSDKAKDGLGKSFKDKYGGLDNVGNIPILEEGMEFKKIALSPQDAMLIETRKMQVDEIARIFRVPPHLLYSLERATYSNIEHQSQEFADHTVRPWVKKFEQEFNRKLFREDERGRYFTRFNLDALLRSDVKSQAEYFTKMFGIGVLSQNDIRRLKKMNGIGPAGDRYYVPLNMIAKEELEKTQNSN